MKKLHFTIIAAFFVLTLVTVSCKKDEISNTEKCDQLIVTYQQAVSDYAVNPNTETCEAFVQALENYINGCSILTAMQRQEFQEEIDGADCSQY